MTTTTSTLALVAAAAVVGVAVLIVRNQAQQADQAPADPGQDSTDTTTWNEPSQTTGIVEDLVVAVDPTTYIPAMVSNDTVSANVAAFLSMIAYSEGTAGPNGYRTLFGGGLFDSFADHPRIKVRAGGYVSSAAGRYQILASTWDDVRGKLNLPDFSPASQDAAAVELIRERGALNDVKAGRLASAISRVAKVWASLPGAGYSQPERKLSALQQAFADAGGSEVTA